MMGGLTSKVSEEVIALTTSIQPKSDVVRVTDTTSTTVLATIVPPFGGFSGITVIVNQSGNTITTVTNGNILTAVTVPVNTAVVFIFSMGLGKYIPGALA